VFGLQSILFLLVCSLISTAQLRQETLKTWDEYIRGTNERMEARIHGPSFLLLDEKPELRQQVRSGKIIAFPVSPQIPLPVPAGLIHDWVGAAFIPGATTEEVLAVLRDYNHYRDYYRPTVADSRTLGAEAEGDEFSMVVVNRELAAKMAFDTAYHSCYQRVDETRWYGVARTTRVQEIRNYGRPDEQRLDPGEGNGYLWRVVTLSRYEQRDGGVYVEIEAIVLSRDIPASVRWLVTPIVRKVSKNALRVSLSQTVEAVHAATTHPNPTAQAKLANSCDAAAMAAAAPSVSSTHGPGGIQSRRVNVFGF
jgi:hypothetical protein